MNPLDVVIVVIIAFTLIRGIFRGLVKEVASIIGVFAGYYAAYTYYKPTGKYLSQWIGNPSYLDILSFILLFCGSFIAISLLGILLKNLLRIAFLGWVNKLGGAAFGFLKGMLIITVLLVALTTFMPKGSPLVSKSQLYPHVTMLSEVMIKFVPPEMRKMFDDKIKELKKTWNKHSKNLPNPKDLKAPKMPKIPGADAAKPEPPKPEKPADN